MVNSFCEVYHWTLPEAMRLTFPQMLMFNHAAYVNNENARRKSDAKRDKEERQESREVRREKEMVSSLSGPELTSYLSKPF
jgi:hypothetical protein